MKKTIYDKYDKGLMASLPKVVFPGRIVIIHTPRQAESAVCYLLRQPILGVDTETRPTFKRGDYHKVALLQVATHDSCFLFRLHHTGMAPAIIRLLEDTTVPKVGLSWHDDLGQLHKESEFTPGLFIELQHEANRLGIEDLSLQKLYANLFGQRISKAERMSNWERDVLSDSQLQYASIDAWACINIYEEILRLEATGDYELVHQESDSANTAHQKTDTANTSEQQ